MTGATVKDPVRLLIVDEHPIGLKTLPPGLRLCGYDCAVASTAAEALAAIDAHRSEVVLLEWYFRDGSGVGLAPRLRAYAATQDRAIVIVVLSSLDEPDGFCAREEIDCYLVKPASIVVIDRAVRPFLAGLSASDATSR